MQILGHKMDLQPRVTVAAVTPAAVTAAAVAAWQDHCLEV